MAYRYNSTIKIKEKVCIRCGKKKQIFSRKRCKECATQEDVMARMEAETEDTIKEEGLWDLIKMADDVFSKWLRLSKADKDGMVECFIFGTKIRWQDSDCAHFVKRGANLHLRFDTRNVTVQSKLANETNDGHYALYREKMEQNWPGITEILEEESRLIAKPTRTEIRAIYNEYNSKYRNLLNSRK